MTEHCHAGAVILLLELIDLYERVWLELQLHRAGRRLKLHHKVSYSEIHLLHSTV